MKKSGYYAEIQGDPTSVRVWTAGVCVFTLFCSPLICFVLFFVYFSSIFTYLSWSRVVTIPSGLIRRTKL